MRKYSVGAALFAIVLAGCSQETAPYPASPPVVWDLQTVNGSPLPFGDLASMSLTIVTTGGLDGPEVTPQAVVDTALTYNPNLADPVAPLDCGGFRNQACAGVTATPVTGRSLAGTGFHSGSWGMLFNDGLPGGDTFFHMGDFGSETRATFSGNILTVYVGSKRDVFGFRRR